MPLAITLIKTELYSNLFTQPLDATIVAYTIAGGTPLSPARVCVCVRLRGTCPRRNPSHSFGSARTCAATDE